MRIRLRTELRKNYLDKTFLKNLANIDPAILTLMGCGIFMFFILITVDSLTGTYRLLKKTKKIISHRTSTFKKLETQAKAINEHASSYANTLGGEGAKLLAELDAIVKEQKEILSSLSAAITNWDVEEILRIESDPVVNDPSTYKDRMKRAENIIQYISGRLAEASITATKLHVPKIVKRQNTIDGLWSVGLMDKKPEKE